MKFNKIVLILISLIVGVFMGLSTIQDGPMNAGFSSSIIYVLYLFFLVIYINKKYVRKGYNIFLFPLLSFLTYLPVNYLSGTIWEKVLGNYFSSFPRYFILQYYMIGLFSLYLLALLIVSVFGIKKSKPVYIIADIISLVALPFLVIRTYFGSPH